MRIIVRLYDLFLDLCGLLAGLTVVAVAFGILAEVLFRNLGARSFPWLIESTEYAICVAVFLAIPWCMREGAHVRMDAFLRIMGPRLRHAIEIIADTAGAVICAVVGWYGIIATLESSETNTIIYKSIVFPEWWLLAVFPLSMALLTVEFLRRLARITTGGVDSVEGNTALAP